MIQIIDIPYGVKFLVRCEFTDMIDHQGPVKDLRVGAIYEAIRKDSKYITIPKIDTHGGWYFKRFTVVSMDLCDRYNALMKNAV